MPLVFPDAKVFAVITDVSFLYFEMRGIGAYDPRILSALVLIKESAAVSSLFSAIQVFLFEG